MSTQYDLLYVILGICLAVLVLSGYRLYRKHVSDLKHTSSLHKMRKRRSQR